jgi:hypothetical protein
VLLLATWVLIEVPLYIPYTVIWITGLTEDVKLAQRTGYVK